jgi:hypothetical protein
MHLARAPGLGLLVVVLAAVPHEVSQSAVRVSWFPATGEGWVLRAEGEITIVTVALPQGSAPFSRAEIRLRR